MTYLPTYILAVIEVFTLYGFYLFFQINTKFIKDLMDQWQVERKDLYDRLMATGFVEYKTETAPEPEPEIVNEDIVDLDEARDEITGEETNG